MRLARWLPAVLAASLLLVLPGCLHRNAQQMPAAMTSPGIVILEPNQLQTNDATAKALANVAENYRTHTGNGQYAQAKIDRNRFVFTIMGQLEASYGTFERSLRRNRAVVETVTDAALLGVTAATAVVGEVAIKDMLSAAGVAGSGTRLSAQKNFFNDEGTVALMTQMRASRSTIEAQIVRRCGDEVTSYSLEEAWKDLNRYANAGTIESAMIQLAANAGSRNVEAQHKLDEAITMASPATVQDVANSRSQATIALALMNAIEGQNGAAPDQARAQEAAEAITAILTKVGAAPPAGTAPAKLVDLLQDKLDAAPFDAELKARLAAAIHEAPAKFGGTGK